MLRGTLKNSNSFLKRVDSDCESGRSMIELMCVLAIAAILTAGGIYGYSFAMAKHRATEAAQYASVAKIELDAAAARRRQHSVKVDLPENQPVSVVSTNDYKNVGIKVDFDGDVSACKQFVQMYENSQDFFVFNACDEEEETTE